MSHIKLAHTLQLSNGTYKNSVIQKSTPFNQSIQTSTVVQVMGVLIRLRHVNIVGYFTTIYYIATCFGRRTIIMKNILMTRVVALSETSYTWSSRVKTGYNTNKKILHWAEVTLSIYQSVECAGLMLSLLLICLLINIHLLMIIHWKAISQIQNNK
jgi:hypothetical protein